MSRGQELINQYKQIHASKPYGRSSELKLGYVQRELMHLPKVERVLDYGCGQSRLIDWLGKVNDTEAVRYDPAIPDYATKPTGKFDAAVCTDVLEHIPEEDVVDFLKNVKSLTDNAYFNVSVRTAI